MKLMQAFIESLK